MANTSLTLAYITSRENPCTEWFYDSLRNQIPEGEKPPEIIVVDGLRQAPLQETGNIILTKPKPTIWQGEYQVPVDAWWAKSNAMNTAICLCTTDFIAFVDDRCVLAPTWLQCVRDAMEGNYAVCGSYEKRSGMKVENGEIIDYGECLGIDTRTQHSEPVPTRDWYGGSCALPLEWCLAVNGFSEDLCDSLGSEDSMFGVTLRNSGYPMKFDSRMRIIEDRTPSEIEGALKRADKNAHLGQKAKSWDIVRAFHGKTTSQNSFDIRNMRDRVLLNGESLSSMIPSASHNDWYDGQDISTF